MTGSREDVLQQIDFGNLVAEKEKNFTSIFVPTERVENEILTSSPPDVVKGPKGSGKSAVFQLFSDHEEYLRDHYPEMFDIHDDEILIVSGSGQEDQLRKGLTEVDRSVDNFDPEQYWKLYFVIKIARSLKNNGHKLEGNLYELLQVTDESDSLRLAPVIKRLYNRIIGPSPDNIKTPIGDVPLDWDNINTSGLLDEEAEYLRDNDITIWLCVDRVDQIGDNREEMKEYVEGLFEAQIFLQPINEIKPKVFVRTDIWSELHITNQDYLETRRLRWENKELLTLINKRMMESDIVRKYIKENMARNIDISNILTYKQQTQKEIFNIVFVKQIAGGQTGSPTFDWMKKRVTNGKDDSYPRELINFCKKAKNEQQNMSDLPDESLIGESSLKNALEEMSRKHVTTVLYSEFEDLETHFDQLKGGERKYTRSELEELFKNMTPSGRDAIKRLYQIGLLKPQNDGGYTDTEFEIPLIYRQGLHIVTRGRK